MDAVFVQGGRSIDYTPDSNVAAGDVVVQGDLVGVATRAIEANTLGALAVEGVFDFAKDTGSADAISAGARLYWDESEALATTESSGNVYLGKAVQAAAADAATVRVRMSQ